MEWVAVAFSRGTSQPRDWAQVSHIAGGFFTIWAIREASGILGKNKTSEWKDGNFLSYVQISSRGIAVQDNCWDTNTVFFSYRYSLPLPFPKHWRDSQLYLLVILACLRSEAVIIIWGAFLKIYILYRNCIDHSRALLEIWAWDCEINMRRGLLFNVGKRIESADSFFFFFQFGHTWKSHKVQIL